MKKVTLAALFSVALVPACSAADDATPGAVTPAANVTVKSNVFDPATVTVKVGDTVRWTWAGGTHNVVSGTSCTADGKFSSGSPVSGATFEKKFETAGTFEYFCDPHCVVGMVGKIVVQ